MNKDRVARYLGHMGQAAADARAFVDGLKESDFLGDRRTQQAVVMSLIVLGEAAARLMDEEPGFAQAHPQIPWRQMRGMRNRIAHGYFDIDLRIAWDTVQTALPALIKALADATRDDIAETS